MREMSAVEDDDLSDDPLRRWKRWSSCGVCKARFKDDVYHALAWGCWKTYTSRPERDELRLLPDGEKARDIGIPWTWASFLVRAIAKIMFWTRRDFVRMRE